MITTSSRSIRIPSFAVATYMPRCSTKSASGPKGHQLVDEPTRYSARRSVWCAAITIAHRNGMKVLPSEVIDVISRNSGSCITMITDRGGGA